MRPFDAAHLTSAHDAPEVRITHRQLPALAEAGYRVVLVAARMDPPEGAPYRGIRVGHRGGRLARFLLAAPRTAWAGFRTGAPVLHLHDAELMPWGLLLRLAGRRVVMDVHEDLGARLRNRHWVPPVLRRGLGWAARRVEQALLSGFDAVLLAEEGTRSRYPSRAVALRNLPPLGELLPGTRPQAERPPRFAYVGRISAERGLWSMLDGIERTEARLVLAGPFAPAALREAAMAHPAWAQVEAPGALARADIASLLGQVRAGLVLFLDTEQYRATQPTKLFECMAAGLPVIASDLPALRRVVEPHRCGLLVDPADAQAVAGAMRWILAHPAAAEAMGRRGRAAIEASLNWETERRTLLDLYQGLLRA